VGVYSDICKKKYSRHKAIEPPTEI